MSISISDWNTLQLAERRVKKYDKQIENLKKRLQVLSEKLQNLHNLRDSFQHVINILDKKASPIEEITNGIAVNIPIIDKVVESTPIVKKTIINEDEELGPYTSRGKAILYLYKDRPYFLPEELQTQVCIQLPDFTRMKAYTWIASWKRKFWIKTEFNGRYKVTNEFIHTYEAENR